MVSSWVPKNTARKARRLAEKAGHDLRALDTGERSAIAACRHDGCSVLLEITGRDKWRFLRLGEGSCKDSVPWIVTGYREDS